MYSNLKFILTKVVMRHFCSLLVKRAFLIDFLFRLSNCLVVSAVEVEDETMVEDTVISLEDGCGVTGHIIVPSITL